MTLRARSVLAVLATFFAAWSVGSTTADVTQQGSIRVTFSGQLTPHRLPRSGAAPVRVAVGAQIDALDPASPPSLRKIKIEINRHGRFNPRGLPICRYDQIQPSTTADALAACHGSLIGKGSFSSQVLSPEVAPFPSQGALYAFNGVYHGKPAILAHVYGSTPVPTSYTIPFVLSRATGTYGTALSAPMPLADSEWGYVTGLSLNLGRIFRFKGERRGYLTADCPAPAGTAVAPFDFARATFFFGSGTISQTLTRSCRAQGR
jgi:hypothetical protein